MIMGVTKAAIEKKMKPYLTEVDGFVLLNGKYVEEASDAIINNYSNVYTRVIENEVGRDKFVVGNALRKISKPLYEIYISDEE